MGSWQLWLAGRSWMLRVLTGGRRWCRQWLSIKTLRNGAPQWRATRGHFPLQIWTCVSKSTIDCTHALNDVIIHTLRTCVVIGNKSAQSNLGRQPRRGTVAHIRRKVPTGYNGAPQIRPQKYPFLWISPQTPLPASSLDASDLRRQTAPGSDLPFFHNALDRPTHGRTHRPTDRPWEERRGL